MVYTTLTLGIERNLFHLDARMGTLKFDPAEAVQSIIKTTRGNRTQPLQKKNATTMDKLKEENEKLKEAFEYEHEKRMKYMEKLSECRCERNSLKSQLEEIEQKTEHTAYHDLEIERLKKENISLNKYVAEAKIHLVFQEDMDKLKEEIVELKEELKVTREVEINGLSGYKKQIEKLKRANELNSELHNTSETVIGELEEENEKLKEKNDGYEALLRCECGVSIERVVEIKEENKKLEAWKYEVIQTAKAMDWDLPEEDSDDEE